MYECMVCMYVCTYDMCIMYVVYVMLAYYVCLYNTLCFVCVLCMYVWYVGMLCMYARMFFSMLLSVCM